MKKLIALALLLGACSPIQVISTAGSYPNASYLGDIQGALGSQMTQVGNDITLTCTIAGMPAFSVARCVGGGFPFTVPAGKTFCLTHIYLQNKYPWEPPRYNGTMHAMYLQEFGVPSVTSHHPDLHFNPPYPIMAGKQLLATISNAQTEPQNVFAFEQGFLVNEGEPCKR